VHGPSDFADFEARRREAGKAGLSRLVITRATCSTSTITFLAGRKEGRSRRISSRPGTLTNGAPPAIAPMRAFSPRHFTFQPCFLRYDGRAMNRRRLICAFWSALALIALALTPGVAQAHQGHSHHQTHVHQGPAHQSHAAVHATPADDVGAVHIVSTQTSHAPAVQELSNARSDDQPDGAASSCNGACCTAGYSCCGSAVAPTPAAFGPHDLRGQVMAMRAGPAGLGVDPEALPKPPKSFA
jgi:hypothetical protein